MLADDTIAAISTPPGEGAVAVLRISGPEAMAIAAELFRGKQPWRDRELHFGRFIENDVHLDDGLMAVFRAPRSYTGEDMVEFHCHGGFLAPARLLEAVLRGGARAAEPGEFTRRAFLNGKMDLTQAEAVMDVIRAGTPRALRAAEDQLAGRLGKEIEEIREKVLQTVAHLEAYIDFPEEGIDPHAGAQLADDIDAARTRVAHLLATADEGRVLREGVRLVLCGAPNAGKSSLLNRLLGFERAIVSPTPGTTRDTIEECASLRGILFRITDTAGLRESDDAVEREGVERARAAIARADVVVHLVDATEFRVPAAQPDKILVASKIDLPHDRQAIPPGAFPVSSVTGEGVDALVDGMVAKVHGARSIDAPGLAAINARHQACLNRADEFLREAADGLRAGRPPELIAAPLRSALDAIGEVVGRADIEEILGRIFRTFCIGK